jgi:hypothetical protein
MTAPRFQITAYNRDTKSRFYCFTWTRDAASGIERAKRDAVLFDLDGVLTDFRAEPVTN